MRKLTIAAIAMGAAGCGAVPPEPQQRSAAAQAEFLRMVEGLRPGASTSCVPQWNSQNMTVIDGATLAFGRTGSQLYIVNLSRGCGALATPGYAMQTESGRAGMCAGDIVKVIDPSNLTIPAGSCVVNSVIPYSRP